MEDKALIKKHIKEELGWAYRDLKWLSEKEAKFATKERKALLKSLSGKVQYSFRGDKLHIGKLSPGCLICGQGGWSCLFLNYNTCTANCFFCPRSHSKKNGNLTVFEGLTLKKPDDYVDLLSKFGYRGVSFSGGEPFLSFEKLLLFIKKIRKRFNDDMYIWVYTNGDLVTKGKLITLKEAGLNEIRFNIAARGYDLQSTALAAQIINIVTVEIPVIPEDYKIVTESLRKLYEIGVNHLNLHTLVASSDNYHKLVDRGYTFFHYYNIPVLESDLTALKIIQYAVRNKLNLPINYCTDPYRVRFQSKNHRKITGGFMKGEFEQITEAGFLRNLSFVDTPENIKKISRTLSKKSNNKKLWILNMDKSKIFIHSSLLKYLSFVKKVLITYYEFSFGSKSSATDSTGKEEGVSVTDRIILKKITSFQCSLNSFGMKIFHKLFIEDISTKKTLDYCTKTYGLTSKNDLMKARKAINTIVKNFRTFEHIESGAPFY